MRQLLYPVIVIAGKGWRRSPIFLGVVFPLAAGSLEFAQVEALHDEGSDASIYLSLERPEFGFAGGEVDGSQGG